MGHRLARSCGRGLGFGGGVGGLLLHVAEIVHHAVNLIPRVHDGGFFSFERLDDLACRVACVGDLGSGLVRGGGVLRGLLVMLLGMCACLRRMLVLLLGLRASLSGVLLLLRGLVAGLSG